jgi:PAS domain-containing protein
VNNLLSRTLRTTAARHRLAELERRAARVTAPNGLVVKPALKELNAALEELEAANEELQSQADELTRARARADGVLRRFDEFANALPVACVWTDQRGVILEANEAAADLLNVARQRLPGKLLTLFFEDRQRFFDALGTLTAIGRVDELEMPVRPRERRARRTHVFVRRLEEDGRCCWFLLATADVPAETAAPSAHLS